MKARNLGCCAILLLALLAGTSTGCIKELEIDRGNAANYLYVDGGVTVGEEDQTVRIGRTPAPGSQLELPANVAEVSVTDVDAGTSYPLESCDGGEPALSFCGSFLGKLETNYRLSFTLEDGSRFESAPDRLGSGTLSPTAEMVLLKRISADGSLVSDNHAALEVAFDIPSGGAEGVVVLAPRELAYAITDRACGPFDGAITCYGSVQPTQLNLGIIDLSQYAGGERFVTTVGREPLSWRFATSAYQQYGYQRLSSAAAPYYSSLRSSVALTGSFFSERPLTVAGNVSELSGGASARPVLGYFGVRETGILRANSNGPEIRAASPRPPCSGSERSFPPELGDCCNCLEVPNTTLERPEWWE